MFLFLARASAYTGTLYCVNFVAVNLFLVRRAGWLHAPLLRRLLQAPFFYVFILSLGRITFSAVK